MHLWHLSTIPSFWVEYFAECLLKGVSWNMFFFLNSRFLFIYLWQDRPKLFQMIVSNEFLKQRDTEAFLKFDSCFSTEFER